MVIRSQRLWSGIGMCLGIYCGVWYDSDGQNGDYIGCVYDKIGD